MKRIEKAQKEKKKRLQSLELAKQADTTIIDDYNKMLDENVKYSLDVDPENKYGMSDEQKRFVKNYCEYKSISIAAEMCNIDLELAKAYYVSYASQQEIRRINLAMYHHQFANRILETKEIAGWLTSVLTDQVPIADRVGTMDKVRIAQLLMSINETQKNIINDPSVIEVVTLEQEVKNMSVDAIKKMLESQDNKNLKDNVIEKINVEGVLSPEEIAYLKTLPIDKLMELVDVISKK